MEPWEDEAEKAQFRRVLLPLGANTLQADTAYLIDWHYMDEEIARIQGVSVSNWPFAGFMQRQRRC